MVKRYPEIDYFIQNPKMLFFVSLVRYLNKMKINSQVLVAILIGRIYIVSLKNMSRARNILKLSNLGRFSLIE